MRDHLARLCFEGRGSSGQYSPRSFSLSLRGVEQPTDHVVYLHEVHHAALNDVTAWGSALHVYARLPAVAGQQFQRLLDACRSTHESFATFSSVQIASARHGPVDGVLAAYPRYIPLYDATVRLAGGVKGANRRQLVVTALARLCMQTPVLEVIIAAGLHRFRLAAIRDLDRPDGRWNWFIRQGPGALAAAAAAADRVVVAEFGPTALASDDPADGDLYASTDRTHDDAWGVWEATAYEHLRTALASTKARTLSFNGHQDATAAVLALASERYGEIGLRAAMNDEQSRDDAALASSVLQQVRHDLNHGNRYRATLLPSIDSAQFVEMLAHRPAIAGQPAIIVDARPASRLATLYRWPADTLPEPLRASGTPVVAIRLIVDDGAPDSVIGHVVLPEPDALARLVEQWHGRGHLIICVSASCVADTAWAQRWMPPMRALGPLFMLVDVEPDRFVPAWARDGREVFAVGVAVNDTAGQRTALLFTADRGLVWWLVVADDVTVRLMGEYLRATLGARLRSDMEMYETIRVAATVAITHVLATESFISFDALGTANVN